MKIKTVAPIIIFLMFFLFSCSSPDLIGEIENKDFKSQLYLSDLIIENFELAVPFTHDTTSYSLVIPYKTAYLKIFPIKSNNSCESVVKLNGNNIEAKNDFLKYQKYYICSPLLDVNKVEIILSEKRYTLSINKEILIKIASWNIANLSDNKTDYELQKISSIISRFDLIAIQEVNDKTVLERIKGLIPWFDYQVTENKVGTGGFAEYYAYFYKKDTISVTGTPYVWDDINDYFVREPFVVNFKSGNFSWTMVNVHILFGNNEAERRPEIQMLDDVITNILTKNPDEKDVILVGDFNFSANDEGWEMSKIDYTNMIAPSIKTTINDVSSYDNFWYNPNFTKEFKELNEVYKFDEEVYLNDYDLAKKEVSDHRPVSGIFVINSQEND